MSNEVVISIKGLKNQFGESVIHENLDLEVYRGEVIGVIGGSGSGKSVLLRTILGLNKPRAGNIEVLGCDMLHSEPQIRRKTEQRYGVLFQDGALFSSLNVSQNIEVPLKEYVHLSPRLRQRIADLKISMVGLPPDTAEKFPSELSGGMRKRAGLARALAMDPEILFLDEPTAGLDPISAAAFDELIGYLQRTLGLTVVMVTHDLDSLNAICNRIAVLAEKRIYAVGTMQEMLKQTHPWLVEYFHGPRARAAGLPAAQSQAQR